MPPYLIIYDGLCNRCSLGGQAVAALDLGCWFSYLPMIDQNQPERRWRGRGAVAHLPGLAPWVEQHQRVTARKSWGDATYAYIRDHWDGLGRRREVEVSP